MEKEFEALNIIKNISLSHVETEEDEDFDGNWVYDTVEVNDGTVEDNYSKQINVIEQALLELKQIKEAKSSEALECLKRLDNMEFHRSIKTYVPEIDSEISETQYLDNTDEFYVIKQVLVKAQEKEKENELLKEIIRSFFDRGCPLHLYVDKKLGLTIEVDSECSIMNLGEYKGIKLDEKLKEVLDNGENKINR